MMAARASAMACSRVSTVRALPENRERCNSPFPTTEGRQIVSFGVLIRASGKKQGARHIQLMPLVS